MFEQGVAANPNGRPKGAVNKTTRSVKASLEYVFEGLGGPSRMLKWAETNPDKFYDKWIRLLPAEVTIGGEITHIIQPRLALSHEAEMIIDQLEDIDESTSLLPAPETA